MSEANISVDGLVMSVVENFYNGDPGSPEDVEIRFFNKSDISEVVATVQIFADAESQHAYDFLMESAKEHGIDIVGTSNIRSDY